MINSKLRTNIQDELKRLAANAPALMSRASVEKLYEIFVLMCLAKALRSLGAKLYAHDSSDKQTNDLNFRLGPGLIYSPTNASGFIRVLYKGKEYEIQNGLRVLGRSKVLHELDVCLVERSEAKKCRANRNHPSDTHIKFLAECKFYGERLDLSLGREFLGLSSEFRMKRLKTIVSNVASDEVHTLITEHGGTENFRVTPLIPQNVDRFVEWLANELRQVLG